VDKNRRQSEPVGLLHAASLTDIVQNKENLAITKNSTPVKMKSIMKRPQSDKKRKRATNRRVSFSTNLEQIRFFENPPEANEPSPPETKRHPKRRKIETKSTGDGKRRVSLAVAHERTQSTLSHPTSRRASVPSKSLLASRSESEVLSLPNESKLNRTSEAPPLSQETVVAPHSSPHREQLSATSSKDNTTEQKPSEEPTRKLSFASLFVEETEMAPESASSVAKESVTQPETLPSDKTPVLPQLTLSETITEPPSVLHVSFAELLNEENELGDLSSSLSTTQNTPQQPQPQLNTPLTPGQQLQRPQSVTGDNIIPLTSKSTSQGALLEQSSSASDLVDNNSVKTKQEFPMSNAQREPSTQEPTNSQFVCTEQNKTIMLSIPETHHTTGVETQQSNAKQSDPQKDQTTASVASSQNTEQLPNTLTPTQSMEAVQATTTTSVSFAALINDDNNDFHNVENEMQRFLESDPYAPPKDRRQSVMMELTQPIDGIFFKESRPLSSPIREAGEQSTSSRGGSSETAMAVDRRKSVPMELTTNLSRILSSTETNNSNFSASQRSPVNGKQNAATVPLDSEDEVNTQNHSVVMEFTQPIGGVLTDDKVTNSAEEDTNEINSNVAGRTRRISIPMDLTQPLGRILCNGNDNTPTTSANTPTTSANANTATSNTTNTENNTIIITSTVTTKNERTPFKKCKNDDLSVRDRRQSVMMELTQPIGGILHHESLDKSAEEDTNEINSKVYVADRTRRISIPMDLTQPLGRILCSNSNTNCNLTDYAAEGSKKSYQNETFPHRPTVNKLDALRSNPSALISQGLYSFLRGSLAWQLQEVTEDKIVMQFENKFSLELKISLTRIEKADIVFHSSLTPNENAFAQKFLQDTSFMSHIVNATSPQLLIQAMNSLSDRLANIRELLKEIKKLEFNYNTIAVPQLGVGALFGVQFSSYLSLNKFRVIFELEPSHLPYKINFRFENVYGRVTKSSVRKIVQEQLNERQSHSASLTDLCHSLAFLCDQTL
jgi:hypothetical protein